MEQESGVRINKYLSQAGILSRRKADEAILAGLVKINDHDAVSGDKVFPGDVVYYDGKIVSNDKPERVILAYNKPLGLVCTSKEADKNSIFNEIDYPDMLYYVGRLDQNSQGLLLLTNDGELANKIQKARNNHEKEYVVRVNKRITSEFISGMMNGVPLEINKNDYDNQDKKIRVTKKCKVEQTGANTFRIILTEGINRQIRRMCEYFDYKVVFLKRVRVMNIGLGNLPVGQYRKLTKNEEATLRELVDKN